VKRGFVSVLVVAALLTGSVLCAVRLEQIPRTDPLGRSLLYLPSPEILKLISVGNPELIADVLYIWSIQYYSGFRPNERFLYLETVYNLITDLDPLFFDAYRIGALIMEIQTGGDQDELERAVRRLFDKGLRNLDGNWELAEAAAWDMFMRFRNRKGALHYAEIGAQQPAAPARIKRMVGVWRDAEHIWTIDDSIEYWRAAVAEAGNRYDRKMCMSHLYDAVVVRDRQLLDQLLGDYAALNGACAENWEELIAAGRLREVPLDLVGNPYEIDEERCVIVALKRIKDQ
jgi:hypothetical protein